MSFQYDPSGFLSSYLMLSIILPFTIIFIYNSRKSKITLNCKCEICLKKEKLRTELPQSSINSFIQKLSKSNFYPSSLNSLIKIIKRLFCFDEFKNKKYIFIFLIICFVLFRNVLTLTLKSTGTFNPYETLEIDENADQKTIKRAYRKKIRQFDSDLFEKEDKKRVDEISMMINKAYQVLLNEENFTENDEKVTFYSLPSVLKNNGNIVLGLYILVLTIYVPYFAYKKWHKSQKYNKLGVTFKTIEVFYNKLNSEIENTQIILLRSLIGILTECEEFTKFSKKYKVPVDFKNYIEMNFGMPLKDHDKITVPYAMLIDHLFRTEFFNDSEFLKLALKLINGMKKVASARSSFDVIEKILILEKMIIQAVFDPNFFELQFPFFRFENLLMKKNLELTEEQKEIIQRIKNFIPKIEILHPEILASSENQENSGSQDDNSNDKNDKNISLIAPCNNDFVLKLSFKRLENDEDLAKSEIFTVGDGPSEQGFALKGNLDSTELINSFGTYRNNLIHCSLPFDKYLEWNIIVKAGNKFFFNQISDFKGVKSLFYTLNLSEKTNLKVSVMSNGYFGNDESKNFFVEVK
ncbi:Protein translocation protein SEC63 [Dictyocoela muelleri]|nr:Protein translocation protein SEC63 [Dictyocoela muelleri]